MNWSDLTVLITGGTGSFGKKFTEIMLSKHRPKKLIVFSRDELKQSEMSHSFGAVDSGRIRFFIGDVRDQERLYRAFKGVDVVVHAAALKQVPACEYNPFEAIQTNIMGSRNVINAALERGVQKVIAISTDKAVNPINLYGATKLCSEKVFVQANVYSGGGPQLSCARYGNVVGSRGSVVPVFREQSKAGRITVTDPRMTRFWITLEQGVEFVIRCIGEMHGGEIFVPKIPSMNIMELAKSVAPNCSVENMGIRLGEKLHEVLISEDEARHTLELDDMYIVQSMHPWLLLKNWAHAKPLPADFRYASDTNTQWLSIDALRKLIACA